MHYLSLKKVAMSVLGLFLSIAVGASAEPEPSAENSDKRAGGK